MDSVGQFQVSDEISQQENKVHGSVLKSTGFTSRVAGFNSQHLPQPSVTPEELTHRHTYRQDTRVHKTIIATINTLENNCKVV